MIIVYGEWLRVGRAEEVERGYEEEGGEVRSEWTKEGMDEQTEDEDDVNDRWVDEVVSMTTL